MLHALDLAPPPGLTLAAAPVHARGGDPLPGLSAAEVAEYDEGFAAFRALLLGSRASAQRSTAPLLPLSPWSGVGRPEQPQDRHPFRPGRRRGLRSARLARRSAPATESDHVRLQRGRSAGARPSSSSAMRHPRWATASSRRFPTSRSSIARWPSWPRTPPWPAASTW